MNKETAYDEHISPLMTKIIALCKEHKINMAATFALDHREDDGQPLYCTTILIPDQDDEPGAKRMRECRRTMYPQPSLLAFTIIGGQT